MNYPHKYNIKGKESDGKKYILNDDNSFFFNLPIFCLNSS